MSEPFMGQIQMWGCGFAPRGWVDCTGATLSISDYTAVYSIVGTVYGGDGRVTFGIPNLKGRAPLHAGHGPGLSAYSLGNYGGADSTYLTPDQLPPHTHSVEVNNQEANTANPQGMVLGKGVKTSGAPASRAIKEYADYDAAAAISMAPQMLASSGGGGGHLNQQPFMSVRFCMALLGIYPSRS